MKIGLITLSNFNYGSVLQSLATQRYLSKYFCDCVLIEKKQSGNRRISQIHTLAELTGKCLLNLKEAGSIIQLAKSQRASSMTLSVKSQEEIRQFRDDYFVKKSYTYDELTKVAASEEYDFFFSGSDQVWNGARISGYDMYFLRFAPKEKRIAWAPSFGGNHIAGYNQKAFAKYLSEYACLSTREESGKHLIQELLGKKIPVLCDPVMLFTGEQWREEYRNGAKIELDEPFAVLFFIDEISFVALDFAKKLCKEKNIKCISFGYSYTDYQKIDGYQHYDGSPYDFLYVLDHADVVITDSFHATAFATLFHTDFYAFSRNYTHGQNQSTRLLHLLHAVGAPERFDAAKVLPAIDFIAADRFFEAERVKSDHYLEECLGIQKVTDKTGQITLFRNPSECCGCGACADTCPKKAITMQSKGNGVLPQIDETLCIRCGKCLSVCGLKQNVQISEFGKKAYIALGKDREQTKKSASGGAFAAIARKILDEGGVVYGAALDFPEGGISCHHVRIDGVRELPRIQNSKYVQSDTAGIFGQVKADLDSGLRVLFSGTSCQIASLLAFLGKKRYENLVTVDLICHGVPPIELLQDYIRYLEKEMHARVAAFSFRTKDRENSIHAPYVMSVGMVDEAGQQKDYYLPLRDSAYYRLFMACAGYRDNCYSCKYASINKPADITLGDYYIQESKSQAIHALGKSKAEFYSCVIVHSKAGRTLLEMSELNMQEISLEDAVFDHEQLRKPANTSATGLHLMEIYRNWGFQRMQSYINSKNRMVDVIKKITGR